MQTLGVGFCTLISIPLLVFLGRAFGSDAFGHYASTLSMAVIGLILIEGGWPTLLYRNNVDSSIGLEASDNATAHAVGHVLLAGAALTILSALLSPDAVSLTTAFACMTLVACVNLASARLRGAGKFGTEAIWQSGVRLASAALIVAVVLLVDASTPLVFLAWSAALVTLLVIFGRQWLEPPQWRNWRRYSRPALPFLIMDLSLALLLKGDLAILGLMKIPATELSYYAACTRFIEAAILMFAPINNILLRSLRIRAGTRAMFIRGLLFAAAPAVTLGVVALILAWWDGEQAVVFVFGAEFSGAGTLFPWVVASLPALLLNLVLVQAANALGMERKSARNLAIGSIGLVLGLTIGHELGGIIGAAKGALVAQTAMLLLSITLLSRGVGKRNWKR